MTTLRQKTGAVLSLQSDVLPQTKSIIFGCDGPTLSSQEKSFFESAHPLGFILFARNIETPEQVKRLIQDLRSCVGWRCPILIDQEGGRVERLKPPHWVTHKPARYFEEHPEKLAANYTSISQMIQAEGFNVNCVPVVDLPVDGAHDIIGDRAYGTDVVTVSDRAVQVIKTCIENSIIPVIKHIPGHGRAMSDSHEALPIVETDKQTLSSADFAAFRHVCAHPLSDQSWGMTAHVIYKDIDPDFPATLSQTIINEVIRAEIGFGGFLVGDDLFMKALDAYGGLPERIQRSQEVGIDAHLYCHGSVEDMKAALCVTQNLQPQSISRFLKSYETQIVSGDV